MKVEVDVLGSPPLTVLMVSVVVKQHSACSLHSSCFMLGTVDFNGFVAAAV